MPTFNQLVRQGRTDKIYSMMSHKARSNSCPRRASTARFPSAAQQVRYPDRLRFMSIRREMAGSSSTIRMDFCIINHPGQYTMPPRERTGG